MALVFSEPGLGPPGTDRQPPLTLTSLWGIKLVWRGVRPLPLAVESSDGQLVVRVEMQPRHLAGGLGAVDHHHLAVPPPAMLGPVLPPTRVIVMLFQRPATSARIRTQPHEVDLQTEVGRDGGGKQSFITGGHGTRKRKR